MFYVTDLDGTFLDDQKRVAPNAGHVLQRLQNMGHRFSIATSRSYIKVQAFLKGLPLESPIVINNGAFIVDPSSGEVYRSFDMSKEIVGAVLSTGAALGGTPIMLGKQDSEQVYIPEKPTKEQEHFILSRPNDPRFLRTSDPRPFADRGIFSMVFHVPTSCSAQFVEAFYALDLPINVATMKESLGIDAVEVLHQNANKGDAIKWLSSHSQIPLSDFVVFGDNGNDTAMFSVAGHRYAVANSTPDIKNNATGIIGDNNSFAVINFLENVEPPKPRNTAAVIVPCRSDLT